MILSVTKMVLIYLNYRLWSIKLKNMYGDVLDTLVFDRNLDIFDTYRLFLFLWMFEFIQFAELYYEFHNYLAKLQTLKGAIMIHDCIYQFLRLFYHSRFKPQQLEMTMTQFLVPVFDLVLVLPLIIQLFKDFSRFSNATKMTIQSKPEINGFQCKSFMTKAQLTPVRGSLTQVPFILTYLSLITSLPNLLRWKSEACYTLPSENV